MDTLTTRPPAAAPTAAEPMTADAFLAREDERKADLVDGVLTHDPPTYQRERLFCFLLFLMGGFAGKRDLGVVLGSRTPVRIDARTQFEPDLLFVKKSRAHVIDRLELTGAPDVAVEIVSPMSAQRDYVRKRAGYERVGVA